MGVKYPLLTNVALRLLSLHATSCSSERNWSLWRFVCRDNRRRLGLERVSICLPFVEQTRLNSPCAFGMETIFPLLQAEKLVFISASGALRRAKDELGDKKLDLLELEEEILEAVDELEAVDISEPGHEEIVCLDMME